MAADSGMKAPHGQQSFHLHSWRDLVDKLHFEIDEYDRTRLIDTEPKWRTYRAVNAAVTAWHIHDWLWNWVETDRPALMTDFGTVLGVDFAKWGSAQSRLKHFGAAIADRHRSLAMCRTIATAAKHARSDRYPDLLTTRPVHVTVTRHATKQLESWHDLRIFADGTVYDVDQWLKESAATWTVFFRESGLYDFVGGWTEKAG